MMVSDVSRPDEVRLETTLGRLCDDLRLPERRPVIILIGAALATSSRGAVAASVVEVEPV